MLDIYLIHDDQEGPESRRLFLEMTGYNVTVMQSGHECLDLIKKHKPALVLRDALIHNMTGFELCEEIRKEFTEESLPIVLCTGLYVASTFRDEALRVGAQAFFTRPYVLDELVATITQVISASADARGEGGPNLRVA